MDPLKAAAATLACLALFWLAFRLTRRLVDLAIAGGYAEESRRLAEEAAAQEDAAQEDAAQEDAGADPVASVVPVAPAGVAAPGDLPAADDPPSAGAIGAPEPASLSVGGVRGASAR